MTTKTPLWNETDLARAHVAAAFPSGDRRDFGDYIANKLAGDFACALSRLLTDKDAEIEGRDVAVGKAVVMAQRAINDLRRYLFDNTAARRVIMAERIQADLDALSSSLGIERSHTWPRQTWVSDAADADFTLVASDATTAKSRLEAALDSEMNPVVKSAVLLSRDAISALLKHSWAKQAYIRQLETDLQSEETESDHWARKATLDGDLGQNPPTFLIDVVEDLKNENARLVAEVAALRQELADKQA